MSYRPYAEMLEDEQAVARSLRSDWKLEEFPRFEFWVCKDGHISRKPGHHRLTETAFAEIKARFLDDPRTRGDLRDWKGAPTFHLDKSP